jgi:hypothetical protein
VLGHHFTNFHVQFFPLGVLVRKQITTPTLRSRVSQVIRGVPTLIDNPINLALAFEWEKKGESHVSQVVVGDFHRCNSRSHQQGHLHQRLILTSFQCRSCCFITHVYYSIYVQYSCRSRLPC